MRGGCRSPQIGARRLLSPASGWLIVVIGIAPCRLQAQQPPPQATIEIAREYYDLGRYSEAREVLDRLLARGTTGAEVLYYRGLVEPSAEQAAERYLGEVIRRYPSSVFADRARFQIAQMRYASGLYLTARDLYGQVARRQGDSVLGQSSGYWHAMTFTYAESNHDSLRVALRQLENLALGATDPGVRGKTLVSIGEITLRLGQADSAVAVASRILEAPYLSDYHARALVLQGQALVVLGRQSEARPLFQMVYQRWPDSWEGRVAEGWLAQQREIAVQARLDSLQAQGDLRLPPVAGQGRWTIQVGAFHDLANASRLVIAISQAGYDAWHTSKRVDGNVYVVVLVGRFSTRTEAVALGNRLRDEGLITSFTPIQNP